MKIKHTKFSAITVIALSCSTDKIEEPDNVINHCLYNQPANEWVFSESTGHVTLDFKYSSSNLDFSYQDWNHFQDEAGWLNYTYYRIEDTTKTLSVYSDCSFLGANVTTSVIADSSSGVYDLNEHTDEDELRFGYMLGLINDFSGVASPISNESTNLNLADIGWEGTWTSGDVEAQVLAYCDNDACGGEFSTIFMDLWFQTVMKKLYHQGSL